MYLEFASNFVGPYPSGDFDGDGVVTENEFRILLGADNITDESLAVQQTRHIAYGIIAPIIIAVGMVGNIFVIVVLSHPHFRGVTYRYFITLAVSDLLGLFFSISAFVHLLHPVTFTYSTAVWYSYLEILFVNVPLSVSILVVVCVTIDRFFSVCRPREFKTVHSWRYAKKGISGAIFLSCFIWLPTCFLKTPKTLQDCDSVTMYDTRIYENTTVWVACMSMNPLEEKWYLVYSWIRQVLVTFLPICILIILNSMIVRAFINITKKRQALQGNSVGVRTTVNIRPESVNSESKVKEDRDLLILLCAITISFFITMVPSGIFNAMYTEFLSTELEYEIFRAVANDLEILNHAMNFYIYILCSKPIRRAISNYCQYRKFSLSASTPSNNARAPYNKAPDSRNSGNMRQGYFSPDRASNNDTNTHQDIARSTENGGTGVILDPSELEEGSSADNYSPVATGDQPFHDNPLYIHDDGKTASSTGRAEGNSHTRKFFPVGSSEGGGFNQEGGIKGESTPDHGSKLQTISGELDEPHCGPTTKRGKSAQLEKNSSEKKLSQEKKERTKGAIEWSLIDENYEKENKYSMEIYTPAPQEMPLDQDEKAEQNSFAMLMRSIVQKLSRRESRFDIAKLSDRLTNKSWRRKSSKIKLSASVKSKGDSKDVQTLSHNKTIEDDIPICHNSNPNEILVKNNTKIGNLPKDFRLDNKDAGNSVANTDTQRDCDTYTVDTSTAAHVYEHARAVDPNIDGAADPGTLKSCSELTSSGEEGHPLLDSSSGRFQVYDRNEDKAGDSYGHCTKDQSIVTNTSVDNYDANNDSRTKSKTCGESTEHEIGNSSVNKHSANDAIKGNKSNDVQNSEYVHGNSVEGHGLTSNKKGMNMDSGAMSRLNENKEGGSGSPHGTTKRRIAGDSGARGYDVDDSLPIHGACGNGYHRKEVEDNILSSDACEEDFQKSEQDLSGSPCLSFSDVSLRIISKDEDSSSPSEERVVYKTPSDSDSGTFTAETPSVWV